MAWCNSRINCSICLDNFTKPKIIDCHHTFCEHCLEDYVKENAVNNIFLCPVCRRSNTLPPKGVKDFPVNFYIEEGRVREEYCDVHHQRIIDGYCTDCDLFICCDCRSSTHQKHTAASLQDARHKFVLQLRNLKVDIHQEIQKVEAYSDSVKSRRSEIILSNEKLCKAVDQHVDTIGATARSHGDQVKARISRHRLGDIKTLDQLSEETNMILMQLQANGKLASSHDTSTNENVKNLETLLYKLRQKGNARKALPNLPTLKPVKFISGKINSDQILEQVGRLDIDKPLTTCSLSNLLEPWRINTNNRTIEPLPTERNTNSQTMEALPTKRSPWLFEFSHNFNVERLRRSDWSICPSHKFRNFECSVGIFHTGYSYDHVQLCLKMESMVYKSYKVQFCLKLIHKIKDSMSKKKTEVKTFTPYDNEYVWCDVIVPDNLKGVADGFVNTQKQLTIQVNITVVDVVLND